MPRLFTYCIPVDDGAAPNPYWGFCTLVLCKPAIRRVANPGDWVVATGSMSSSVGDLSNRVVYAMRVTKKYTMSSYDTWVKANCPEKIPDWENADVRRRVGDSVYVFERGIVTQRKSVHTHGNQENDLSGKFALISSNFLYFGREAIRLPEHLLPIVQQGRGHRSDANAPFVEAFMDWITGLPHKWNALHGEPQIDLSGSDCVDSGRLRCEIAREEEEKDAA